MAMCEAIVYVATLCVCRWSRAADRGPGTLRGRRLAPGCAFDAWPSGPRGHGSQSLASPRLHPQHRLVSPAEDGPYWDGRLDTGGLSPVSLGRAVPVRARPRLWGRASLSLPALHALGIEAFCGIFQRRLCPDFGVVPLPLGAHAPHGTRGPVCGEQSPCEWTMRRPRGRWGWGWSA